jgi:hypothetical protein
LFIGKNNAFSSWKDKIKTPTEESNIGTVSEIPIKESTINNKESAKGPDIAVNEIIKANNPVKDRLIEEITKEDLRTTQLESLLEGRRRYKYLCVYKDIKGTSMQISV